MSEVHPKVIFVAGTDMLPYEEKQSGHYFSANQSRGLLRCKKSEEELQDLRKVNNPRSEPVGHFTGRCSFCGSNDLWDDNLAYGCNCCGAMLGGN